MGTLLRVLEIIFKVQRKMSNEKITRREINFPIYKTCFFPFKKKKKIFGPLLSSNLITFIFIIHFKWFKVLYEHHLKFYNHLWALIIVKQHTRIFLGVWELTFITLVVCFFEFLPPLFWGAITFSILFHFWQFLLP
jgi:hypothetical protein